MVFRSASSFMCATISTSPVLTSVTTALTSPLASNLGVKVTPSSISCVDDDKAASCLSPSPRGARRRRASKEDGEILKNKRRQNLTLSAAQHGHETPLLAGVLAERTGEMR